jgi:hypothetical protein
MRFWLNNKVSKNDHFFLDVSRVTLNITENCCEIIHNRTDQGISDQVHLQAALYNTRIDLKQC